MRVLDTLPTVAVSCRVVPSGTEAGDGVTAIETRVAVVPLPLRGTVWGLLLALSLKLKVPERVPVVVGWNVTDAVQLAPAAKVPGVMGQLEVTEKSVRLLATFEIVRAVDWLFVNVTVCGGLEMWIV